MSLKDTALKYISYGLSVIPTTEKKTPAIKSWKEYQSRRMTEKEVKKEFTKPSGIAIICGAVSGNLEVIDVDTKYDLTGKLWEELYKLIEDNIPEIFNTLVIAQTKSGGYHIYYKCKDIKGNLKLANRNASAEELKKDKNDKIRVLIETRGEGGYVIAPDTKGYKFIKGSPDKIPLITPEQREKIFFIAKSFNEIEEPVKVTIPVTTPVSTNKNFQGLGSFEDYNERGDIIGLLISQGWSVTKEQGDRIYLKRAGDTKAESSGNFHTKLRVLYIFSTSTVFEAMKGYSPSSAYAILECNGDLSLASKRLTELGYGDKKYKAKAPTYVKTDSILVEGISKDKEKVILSNPASTLKVENIKAGEVIKVNIYYTASAPPDEILQAVALLETTTEAKIYLKEVDTIEPLSKVKEVLKPYEYKLHSIINKYSGKELNAEGEDEFLQEIVKTASTIQEPIDRDLFKKTFLSIDEIKELGISKASLDETVEKIQNKKDKVIQEAKLKALLDEAEDLQHTGKTEEAISKIETGLPDIKAISGSGLLPPALSYSTLIEGIGNLPPAFKTGYKVLDKFVGFTTGAITLIAGRPSHGKTTLMFNLLLQMSQVYQKENYKFYFFTYEEPITNIVVKLINRLADTDLSQYYNNYNDIHTNYEFIKAYIKAKREDIKKIEEAKESLRMFIDEKHISLIDRSYSVEDLSKLIAYFKQREKIGAVFIDYIQRMNTERKTQDIRTQIAHISDQVLKIAKDNNLPIILGAQLNRATTGNKRPTLENLKEAGNLEEDANTVISVYNESREKEEDSEGKTFKGMREVELEIKTLKNREGEVNKTALLNFDKWTGAIEEYNK